jgi:hypothetical protein
MNKSSTAPIEANEEKAGIPAIKKPRHVAIAINHLKEQRAKALSVRDKAAREVEELDAALLALGWLQ